MMDTSASLYAFEDIEQRYHRLRATYGERDSDIYISSYTRSGTTWTQMILYQLTTDGRMDFEHIFDVSPWLFYNAIRGTEPVYTQEPRILKTHDNYNLFSKEVKGRFIYVIRNGMDVLVSFFYHRKNAKGFTGSFDDHFTEFIHGMKYNGRNYSWFEHVKEWVENKNNVPVLYMKYESLKNDFDIAIDNIVKFCDIKITDDILKRTKERTSFSFLKKYELRLGPVPAQFSKTVDAPYKVKNQNEFIRKGLVGEGRSMLTRIQKDIYFKKFHEVLGHIDFIADYGK